MAVRLVVALAVLCAVACASPSKFAETDIVVPETFAIQVTDQVDLLKYQFQELQTKAKAGMEVTPGVVETVNKMVDMIEADIEPAILDAHRADQDSLNTLMNAVQDHNNEWVEKERLLQEDANNVRALIDDEQAKSQAWEEQAHKFTNTQDNYLEVYDKQTKTCCDRDNAAVLDVEYVPAYASCDYRDRDSSGDCAKVARDAVSGIVSGPFSDGLTLYRQLRASCKDLTKELAEADADTQQQWEHCGSLKQSEKAASLLASQNQDRIQGEWDESTEYYHGNYSALMLEYHTAEVRIKSDAKDRLAEWDATQTIKCMLEAYKEGGNFDEAQEAKCKEDIKDQGVIDLGYPKRVAEHNPKLEPFEDQIDDSAYENTCDSRTAAPEFSCVVKEARPFPECAPAPGGQ